MVINCNYKWLSDLAVKFGLQFGLNHEKANYDYTYVNERANHRSTIDHYILPNFMYDCVESIECVNNDFNPSLHRALKIEFNVNIHRIKIGKRTSVNHSVAWHKVSDTHINYYQKDVERKLRELDIPTDAIQCKDVLCQDVNHKNSISDYCQKLIMILVETGDNCFPKVKCKDKNIPYWNEAIQPLRDESLFWREIWKSCGEPRSGIVADIISFAKIPQSNIY